MNYRIAGYFRNRNFCRNTQNQFLKNFNFEGFNFEKFLLGSHVFKLSKMAFAITFVVRGYHVYKDIWAAEIGSELLCFPEPHNREDPVAVMDGTSIVGHVPRKISYICYIFLLHSGSIICRVTGPRQYSQDLEQGGVDVP